VTTLVTFGDSILDSGHYNAHGVHPGGLIVRNDDALFPEFRGRDLPVRPVYLGTVYDPTFGSDADNFLGIDPRLARANHARVNAAIAAVAARYGTLVDLHAHFLAGDPSWFTQTIEPSLQGASEVRRAFGAALGL
jgi:hypothetical protein